MRILLDTHVFLWYTKSDRKLSTKSRSMIQNAIEVYVSSASIWEAAIKVRLGKLDVKIDDLVKAITSSGFLELPITAEHAAAIDRLSDLHRDPFDRILLAQAITEPLTFLTADEILKDYSRLVTII
jgi:PIN domain nuclease of toxin-antitoxin system